MTSAYEINRKKNRPDLQPTDFLERYKNRELGKQSIDDMISGLENDWNNLDDGVKKNIVGTANFIGNAYNEARSISPDEKYNPIAYLEAGALRTGEFALNTIGKVSDFLIGNPARGIGWLAGLDPRGREALAIGAQIYLGPKALTKLSKLKPKHLGITTTIEPYVPPKGIGDGIKKVVTKPGENAINITANAVDETLNLKPDIFRRASKIYKANPNIGMKKAIQEAKLLEGFTPSQLITDKTYGSLKGGLFDKNRNDTTKFMWTSSVDPKDVPKIQPGMWMTAGRQSKPLSAKFFDDAGWIGGRLNLKSWRDAPGDGKAIAEQFLTAQGKGVVFSTEAAKKNLFMSRVFGIEGAKQLLGLPEDAKNIFQAHHQTATKAVLTGQEGLVYDSPYYHEIQKVWEDLELTLGNNPDNIIGTLGLVQRDLDAPHSLIHKFLDSKMGPDGTAFWTPEKMNQIVIYDNAGNAIGHKNFKLRKKWTKEQALIFKEAVDLLKLAHEQYYLAKGVRPGPYLTAEPILDEDIVNAFINKLPPKGGTGRYTTDIIKKIAREIAEEKGIKPTITDVNIQDVMDKRLQGIVDTMYKFAVTESNGEDMLLDAVFGGLTSSQAIKKWKGNDPSMVQLSIRFNRALKEAKTTTGITILKDLYIRKYGEIPPAMNFDLGRDD